MEDAMIINKSSYERGLAHGTVYKRYLMDFTGKFNTCVFSNQTDFGTPITDQLDLDGLP